jgi:hypothetical protein
VQNLSAYFQQKSFTVVAAFSALQLFDDDLSLQAISQVLVPGGQFIDAGDGGACEDPLGKLMKDVAQRSQIELFAPPPLRRAGDEQRQLEKNGFCFEKSQEVEVQESYTPEQILAHFKSRLRWPLCTVKQEENALNEIRAELMMRGCNDKLYLPVKYRLRFYRKTTSDAL